MNKKKIAIMTAIGYILFMIIGVFISNIIISIIGGTIVDSMDISEANIISKLIIQIPPTIFLLYVIRRFYEWKDIGFRKINIRNIIWFTPYVVILVFMVTKFILEIYKNAHSFTTMTWITMLSTFIGVFLAGFSEEVIFRGVFLSSFRNRNSIIGAMIISSLGFSIVHFFTIVMGISIIDVFYRIIYSSLLGFAFVGLVIKINNMWPIIIFHIIWNYIIMVSNTLNIEISRITSICNLINVIVAILLWIIIIKDQIQRNSLVYNIDNLISDNIKKD